MNATPSHQQDQPSEYHVPRMSRNRGSLLNRCCSMLHSLLLMCMTTAVISQPLSAGEIRDLESEINVLKTQMTGLAELDGTAAIQKAAMILTEDKTIQRYYPKFNDLLLEKQQALETGLGEEHPNVRACQTQLDSFRAILMEAVKDASEVQEQKLSQLEARLVKAKAAHAEGEVEGASGGLGNASYYQAREEYQSEKFKLLALLTNSEASDQDDRRFIEQIGKVKAAYERMLQSGKGPKSGGAEAVDE